MKLKELMAAVLMSAALVAPASAQLGAIISIIGGGYSAGQAQQEKERRSEAWQKQLEAERREDMELLEADRAQHKANAEAKRIADEQRAAERAEAIRTKRFQPATIEDLEEIYDAEDGLDIAESPKLKPDRAQYILSGTIDRHVADNILLCLTAPDEAAPLGHYFTVRFSKKTKKTRDILDRMRIGGSLYVVGKYVANVNYQTVMGAWKVMPIFEADHLVVPD